MKSRSVALGLGAAVVLAAGAGVVWRRQPPVPAAQAQTPDIMIAERSAGSPAAPIVIYEFSDFQCPYCRKFWLEILPTLEKEYISTGKARLVFLNYPLVQLHPNAPAAHNFAMCAARQNRFWRTHNLLFQHQQAWENQADPSKFFGTLADSASLDRGVLATCLSRKAEDWLVQADAREAMNAGISGTPAFVVNGGLLPGVQPLEVWRPILDSIYRTTQK